MVKVNHTMKSCTNPKPSVSVYSGQLLISLMKTPSDSMIRLLPPVCRQIVLNNIWSYTPIRVTEVKALCQIDFSAPLTVYDRIIPITILMLTAPTDRAEEVVRPALHRKIFHALTNRKGRMEWPVNETFKKGLRNALTGLYAFFTSSRAWRS